MVYVYLLSPIPITFLPSTRSPYPIHKVPFSILLLLHFLSSCLGKSSPTSLTVRTPCLEEARLCRRGLHSPAKREGFSNKPFHLYAPFPFFLYAPFPFFLFGKMFSLFTDGANSVPRRGPACRRGSHSLREAEGISKISSYVC